MLSASSKKKETVPESSEPPTVKQLPKVTEAIDSSVEDRCEDLEAADNKAAAEEKAATKKVAAETNAANTEAARLTTAKNKAARAAAMEKAEDELKEQL